MQAPYKHTAHHIQPTSSTVQPDKSPHTANLKQHTTRQITTHSQHQAPYNQTDHHTQPTSSTTQPDRSPHTANLKHHTTSGTIQPDRSPHTDSSAANLSPFHLDEFIRHLLQSKKGITGEGQPKSKFEPTMNVSVGMRSKCFKTGVHNNVDFCSRLYSLSLVALTHAAIFCLHNLFCKPR